MRLIDADALGVGRCNKDVLPSDYCTGWNRLIDIINETPTIDAVPVRHGHWVEVGAWIGKYECSACGGMDTDCDDYYGCHYVLDQEYCPYCGAKMDEPRDDKQN